MRIAALLPLLAGALCADAPLRLATQVAVRAPRLADDQALSTAQIHARARMQDDVTALQIT
jgi:hypothetical protein